MSSIRPPGPFTFLPPVGAPRWSGTIRSTTLAGGTPIDSDVRGVDAGDTVTFAIMIENTGTSLKGAFDIVIRDHLPAQYQIPATGSNLQVYYGNRHRADRHRYRPGDGLHVSWEPCGPDGTADTPDDLFGWGIQLVDPVGAGVCSATRPEPGEQHHPGHLRSGDPRRCHPGRR